jgi:hypothetical protein
MIKIGDIDIGKTIIELQFQTKLNAILIEKLLQNRDWRPTNQEDILQLKRLAMKQVNDYYGKQMIDSVE